MRPLQYDDDNIPNSRCSNCCRDFSPTNDKIIYGCWEDNCIYEQFGFQYYVCSNCYEEESDDIKNDWDQENKANFTLEKFACSIASSS